MKVFMPKDATGRILSSNKFHDKFHVMEIKPGRTVKVPPGVDWKFDPYDINIGPKDKIQIENIDIVRTVKGDSIATTMNTDFGYEGECSTETIWSYLANFTGPSDGQQNG